MYDAWSIFSFSQNNESLGVCRTILDEYHIVTSDMVLLIFFSKDAYSRLENDVTSSFPEVDIDVDDYTPAPVTSCVKLDKSTQRPNLPDIPYKNQCERGQREIRSEIIDTLRQSALKAVQFEERDLPQLITEIVGSKKWISSFGVNVSSTENNPILESLIKDYNEFMSKEKAQEVKKRAAAQKAKLFIGSSLKDSRLTLSGDKTPQEFKNRVVAAGSVGRITFYADERRRLLSIVAMDYPYRFLQEQFGCSPNTITAGKVHAILFGRGGTPPSKFKFQRQCVSPAVLEELSEFFMRDDVSRPSSCRSIIVNGQETPVRYWKDSIKNLVNQYLLEFPNGVKRTYIYSHLPPSFRSDTMLAGLCNLCDDYGHSNYDKMQTLLSDIEYSASISLKEEKAKVTKHQQFLKMQFGKIAERHSPCLELCMAHAFGSCTEAHPSSCPDVVALVQVEKVAEEHLKRITDTSEQDRLKGELQEVMTTSVLYASHLLRTKHQANYHKFVLNNLQPGEVVVIIDYKMKLELGVRLREIQRDWYGKRGISLHGLLAIAQVDENKKVSEVLDLWSEDTKQDSWFSQSAMDVGFTWLQQAFPGFRVYLFSGKCFSKFDENYFVI